MGMCTEMVPGVRLCIRYEEADHPNLLCRHPGTRAVEQVTVRG